ncbi:hypothetical protein F0562_018439 [Nyssa sinensis]|uniref:DUF4408 domain-containing protein n=1 Tax=Nyssa sinensis TaxID=561372 RepID=A0A5J4ZDH8_9ASTE|nr:hypothetical protein F0562_018439 [Nyssa sinensis]
MASSSTWILSLKVLLISIGVVSLAMVIKLSIPLIINFAVYEVPGIWSTLLSWLRPPYVYIIVNAIIIIIAASSRLHHKLYGDNQSEPEPPQVSTKPPPPDLHSGFAAVSAQPEFHVLETPVVYESEARVSEVIKDVVMSGPEVGDQDRDEFDISRSTWTPPQRLSSSEIQTDFLFPATEKPLVSSRFAHRKPVKASPEGGRALRVAKPKRHETFEHTWKAITDGRQMPLTRHLKKSDTWETHGRTMNASPQNESPPIVNKSETLKDRTKFNPRPSATASPVSGKLRKEPSLTQDELNRRVEAFIKKFNEEMRLQRQESLNQYMEMINRGAH